jgi:hypothetical protein
MQIYSAAPAARTRQIAGDVVAVVGIVLFVVLGVVVAGVIEALADVGRTVENAGSRLRSTLGDAAETLGGVPLVGKSASAPLQQASQVGDTFVDAGQRQQELIGHLSLAAGLVVSLVPIAVILVVWLRPRLRFVRRVAEVRGLSLTDGGLQLLAFRALATGDSAGLLRLSPNPVAAWSAGDDLEQRQLAEFALREAGVLR